MTEREKYLLLQLLMVDIRMSWGREFWGVSFKIFGRFVGFDSVKKRRRRAMELAEELCEFAVLGRLCMLHPGDDGRWLRAEWHNGGYEGLEVNHRLKEDDRGRFYVDQLSPEFWNETRLFKCPVEQFFHLP